MFMSLWDGFIRGFVAVTVWGKLLPEYTLEAKDSLPSSPITMGEVSNVAGPRYLTGIKIIKTKQKHGVRHPWGDTSPS